MSSSEPLPLAPFSAFPPMRSSTAGLSAEAFLKPGASAADLDGEGVISAGQFTAWGRTLTLRGATPLKVSGGRSRSKRLTLAEAVRPETPSGVPTLVTLSGSAQFVAPRSLDVSASGSVDAIAARPGVCAAQARRTRDARPRAWAGPRRRRPSRAARPSTASTSVSADGSVAFESATGSLLFSEGKVTISDLSLRFAGGTVDLGGSIGLDGWKPDGMRITALVSHVKVSPFDGFRSTFSGNVLLLGDSQPRAVRGELTFDRALYDRDFRSTSRRSFSASASRRWARFRRPSTR